MSISRVCDGSKLNSMGIRNRAILGIDFELDKVKLSLYGLRFGASQRARSLYVSCGGVVTGAACKSMACVRLCSRGQSCLHALSTGCGPYAYDIRTSYVSRQYTSSVGDSAAPCLLRGLATSDWLLLAS
ncbi:hypothetical protein Tco_0534620 [Tanacetum coccineum]